MAENEIFARLTQYYFEPVNQNFCVGTWRNYAIALQRFSGQAYYVYVAVRIQKSDVKPLRKVLKEAVKASGIKKAGVNRVMPNFIHGFFNFDKSGELQSFAAYMETLTAALMQNGVAPANTCAVTGAPNPDSLCLVGTPNCFGYQPVCAAAVRQTGYAAQEKAEDNENNGSYLTGLIGAVLGTLVGVAVNVLVMVFLQRIFAMLFALVPICAMFGYKLFKGKTDKVSMVIVIVLSVLAVPLMEFLNLGISLAKEYSVPISQAFEFTTEYFFDSEILKETLPEMGKMLLFMGLGVLIAWTYMRNQLNSTKTQSAQLQLNSMRPNPNCQAAQPACEAAQQTYQVTQQ
jgi:hypothetical protein